MPTIVGAILIIAAAVTVGVVMWFVLKDHDVEEEHYIPEPKRETAPEAPTESAS
jgi:flagellar basal body-associated protein FliL